LRGSVWKSVQQVFDECLAQVLPEPVGTGLQTAVKENTSAYLIGTTLSYGDGPVPLEPAQEVCFAASGPAVKEH
jgi:hypothetical protein